MYLGHLLWSFVLSSRLLRLRRLYSDSFCGGQRMGLGSSVEPPFCARQSLVPRETATIWRRLIGVL
jgi:hypothetical protein